MREAMAANDDQPTPLNRTMHMRMPEPASPALVTFDHDASSAEDLPEAAGLHEEDAHSVIGVSISRAQTRLMSPQTPAAEKAAAIGELDGGGLFDSVKDEDWHEAGAISRNEEEDSAPESEIIPPSIPPTRQHSIGLPSPWRAEPKTFEKQTADAENRQHPGPTSMLSDLNIRRYMASFNLPSMPKTPSFKDFSVPSLTSILNNTRSHSPLRKNESRQKRASTIEQPRSDWGVDSKSERRSTLEPRPREVTGRGRLYITGQPPQKFGQNMTGRSLPTIVDHTGADSNVSTQSLQPLQLRRTTSDQSLLLRRVTSGGSSLGDDTRWEHIQEQVNSRMKAIKDSLQDSSIKLPSLPNLSTLNLDSFRPVFTRNRANSEAKRPTVIDGHAYLDSADPMVGGKSCSSGRGFRDPKNAEIFQANGKMSKAIHSHLDEALENLTGDIVILGGYRGSILRSAQPPYRQLWVPVKVGLNIRKVNLEVGLQPEDEENMHDHIFASGMLSHIGPVDMGRRLLKRLRTCKNAVEGRLRVHDYGYDWRLSPHFLSRRFLAFLQELQCNAPDVPAHERGATVIAHSMGGLITRHAVNRRPELFAGVVYAGVPQHCVNILGPLRNGDEVLLSSKVLTAQVNFSLRSSFLLLPDDGKCFINKETKEEYPVDFFDVKQWKEYAWSPCIAPTLPPANPQDNKSMLESMTSMLPSMPSLPLTGRKTSAFQPRDDSNTITSAAETASTKINDITNSSATRALDPQFSPTSTPNHTINPQTTIPLPAALIYLTRTLAATLAFKAEMVHDPTYSAQTENLYPPLSVLYANNTPTVVAARVSSRDAIKRADAYDDLQFASGDGVCLARAAMLPEGYVCERGGKVRTERGHVGLLGDLEAVGRCLCAVREGRRRGVGLGATRKGIGHG